MKKYFFWLFCALIIVSILFQKEIGTYIANAAAQRVDAEEQMGIGSKAPDDLRWFDVDNNPVSANKLLNTDKIVLVYSESCKPCQQAVAEIAAVGKSQRDQFVVLIFADAMPDNLKAYADLNIVFSDQPRQATLFSGYLTPSFYFVKNKVLVRKKVGFYQGMIAELQQTVL